jgi:hypothetical protein
MGKSTPEAPQIPDPVKTARAEAEINRISQITPTGNTLYLRRLGGGSSAPNFSGSNYTGGGGGSPTALSPDQQLQIDKKQRELTLKNHQGWGPGEEARVRQELADLKAPTYSGGGSSNASYGGSGFDNLGLNIPEGYDLMGDQVAMLQESPNQRAIRLAQEQASTKAAQALSMRIDALPTGEFAPSGLPDIPGYNVDDLGAAPGALNTSGLTDFNDVDLSALNDLPGIDSETRKRVEDAWMTRAFGLVNPQRDREEEQLRQRLANQGFATGSEGYGTEMDRFLDANNRQDTDLSAQAILAGGSELEREFGLASARRSQMFGEDTTMAGIDAARRAQEFGERGAVLSSAEGQRSARSLELMNASNFGLANRSSKFNEEAYKRSLPFNELAATIGGSQITPPAQANQISTPQVGYGQHMAAQQNAQMARYQGEMQANQGLQQGLFGLAGNAAMAAAINPGMFAAMSHSALKENKQPVGPLLDKLDSLDVERWNYKPEFEGKTFAMGQDVFAHAPAGPHIGPYAEQFAELFEVGDGKTINPVDAVGVCLGMIKEMKAELDALKGAA